MPNHAYTPTAFPGEIYYGQCWVPVDDVIVLDLHLLLAARPAVQQRRARRNSTAASTSMPRSTTTYMPLRNLRNDYLIDRKVQKHDTFTGIDGVSEQDAAIQDSMGPIQDRTSEHLGPTDIGVVEFRKLLMGGARALPERRTSPRPPPCAAATPCASGGCGRGTGQESSTPS